MRAGTLFFCVLILTACQAQPRTEYRQVYLPGQVVKSEPPAETMVIEPQPVIDLGRPWCDSAPRPDCLSQRDVAELVIALACWGRRAQQRAVTLMQWSGKVPPGWWELDGTCGNTEKQ